jgi:hypothetical protein
MGLHVLTFSSNPRGVVINFPCPHKRQPTMTSQASNYRFMSLGPSPANHPDGSRKMWMSKDLLENPDAYAWLLKPLLMGKEGSMEMRTSGPSSSSEVPSLVLFKSPSSSSLPSLASTSSSSCEAQPEPRRGRGARARSNLRRPSSKRPEKVRDFFSFFSLHGGSRTVSTAASGPCDGRL